MPTEMNWQDNYLQKIKESHEFVNYWIEIINRKISLELTPIHSSNLQRRSLCDTREGFEFKNDKISTTSKNFWIEIAEKNNPSQDEFFPSGICRKDNAWMYCMGDFEKLWFLPKRKLLEEYASKKWTVIPNKEGTSMAFLLDKEYVAKNISVLEITANLEEKVAM